MKLKIKTSAASDSLLRQVANELDMSPEDVAEVAVYNLLASYLADARGVDVANDFLNQAVSHPGHVRVGKPSVDSMHPMAQLVGEGR